MARTDCPRTRSCRWPAPFSAAATVIVAWRHYADGATDNRSAGILGTLTPEEHYQYLRFTIDAARELYVHNRYVRYVAVFQNWLKASRGLLRPPASGWWPSTNAGSRTTSNCNGTGQSQPL